MNPICSCGNGKPLSHMVNSEKNVLSPGWNSISFIFDIYITISIHHKLITIANVIAQNIKVMANCAINGSSKACIRITWLLVAIDSIHIYHCVVCTSIHNTRKAIGKGKTNRKAQFSFDVQFEQSAISSCSVRKHFDYVSICQKLCFLFQNALQLQ